jgi:hypothetical protein
MRNEYRPHPRPLSLTVRVGSIVQFGREELNDRHWSLKDEGDEKMRNERMNYFVRREGGTIKKGLPRTGFFLSICC